MYAAIVLTREDVDAQVGRLLAPVIEDGDRTFNTMFTEETDVLGTSE